MIGIQKLNQEDEEKEEGMKDVLQSAFTMSAFEVRAALPDAFRHVCAVLE